MTKTTVYLDPIVYQNLKALAQQQKKSPAELIRAAVADYARAHYKRPRPRSLGKYSSGVSDISERTDEYLKGMGEDGLEPR